MNQLFTERLAKPPGRFPFVLAYVLPIVLIAAPAILIELVAFVAIVYFHRSPERRRWKYEAIFLGVWGFGLDLLESTGGKGLALLWVLAPVLASATMIPLHRLLLGTSHDRQVSLSRARSAYLATHRAFTAVGSIVALAGMMYFSKSGQTAGTLFILFVLLAFAQARYFAGEALTRFPVVYLRAFSSKDVFRTFSSIIAPAISSVHVIIGLTPARERKKLIKNRFGLSTASLYIVPDEVWQNWVQRELERAYAVIFDFSLATENLDWELGEALRICDSARMAMLVQDDLLVDAPQAIKRIILSKGWASTTKARQQLRSWLLSLPDSS